MTSLAVTDPLAASWNALALEYGSPFQSFEFCRTFERYWPASFRSAHVIHADDAGVSGLAPAYLYESCPRVDYYRAAGGTLPDRVLLSHALVGWHGFPVACSDELLEKTIVELARRAADDHAVCVFAGIDGRDTRILQVLKDAGFALSRFHTLMVRALDGDRDHDPLTRLRSRYRISRGAKIRRARAAGVTSRRAVPQDFPAAIELMTGVLRARGVQPSVLSADYLRAVLAGNLPGLEALIAVEQTGEVIGVNVNFNWGRRYMMWLGGYRHDVLSRYCQGDLLYHACLTRAVELGCLEIQGGRSPYTPKLEYGFYPVPLMGAVFGATASQHARAEQWLGELAGRHLEIYPELRAGRKSLPLSHSVG